MNKVITSLILLLIIISGVAPFFLTQSSNNSLSIGTSIISALASIVTLWIALLLYSKYGVEKSFIDKQTEAVFRLLIELKKSRFWITEGSGSFLQLFLDNLSDDFYNEYKDNSLLFNISYAEGLNNIWEITEDIFLPPEIVEKIRPLMVHSIISEKNSDKYMLVTTILGHSDKSENEFFGKLNNKDITLQEFINQRKLVIKESKKWLKEYSNIKIKLNFERI